jgi:L-alanine-DL-glutamate epimerase-like enolase superfamily enzyme
MSGAPLRARVVRFRLPTGDGRSGSRDAEAPSLAAPRRTGFLLEIRDSQGRSGWGEASPLAAYSGERPVEAAAGLLRLLGDGEAIGALLEMLEAPGVAPWIGASAGAPAAPALARLDERLGNSASARSAVISALADLAGRRAGVPTHELLLRSVSEADASVFAATAGGAGAGPANSGYRINALVPLTGRHEALASATDAYARGIRVLKAKLGSGEQFDRELELLHLLRGEMGDDLVLRLDANGSWTLDEARANLDRLAPLRPEYVEEVVRGEAMTELERSPVPLAADESLRDAEVAKRLLDAPAVSVLVLKPTLLGGLDRCLDLGLRAIRSGLRCVVTHGFEGPVGHGAACELALGLAPFDRGGTEGRPLAQGLDRQGVLDAWMDVAVPQLRGPLLVPAEVSGHGVDPGPLLERAGGDGVI